MKGATAMASGFALGACLALAHAAPTPAAPRYRLVMSADDEVCRAVERPLNHPPAVVLAPFSMHDVAPFSNVRRETVPMMAGRFKTLQEVVRIAIGKEAQPVAVLPFSTVFPNGTFDTSLTVVPAAALGIVIEQDRLPALAIGRIEAQRIHLRGSSAAETTDVNDFDLLAVGGRPYLFMRTYSLDDERRERPLRRWAIVARLKALVVGQQPSPKSVDLDRSTEPVCYFAFGTAARKVGPQR